MDYTQNPFSSIVHEADNILQTKDLVKNMFSGDSAVDSAVRKVLITKIMERTISLILSVDSVDKECDGKEMMEHIDKEAKRADAYIHKVFDAVPKDTKHISYMQENLSCLKSLLPKKISK